MKPSKELYRDRRGIAYADRHLLLPARTDMWPAYPPRVTEDTAGAQQFFHGEFGRGVCWWCGRGLEWNARGEQIVKLELHHLAAGSRGRSHERELFCMADSECHANHVGKDKLGRWLYLKWKYDHEYTDWEFLTIRIGRHLPPLATLSRQLTD